MELTLDLINQVIANNIDAKLAYDHRDDVTLTTYINDFVKDKKEIVGLVVDEKTLRSRLSFKEAYKFLKVLKGINELTIPPNWISETMLLLNINIDDYDYYLDTLSKVYGWITTSGIDVDDPIVRSMLDFIGVGNPDIKDICDRVKTFCEVSIMFNYSDITNILNSNNIYSVTN